MEFFGKSVLFLGAHPDARTELRLRARSPSGTRTFIMDRVFRDQGRLWIVDYKTGAVPSSPQVASVGFTEQKLIADGMTKGKDYEVGKYNFTAHGKAIAAAHTDGFVKIIRGLPRGEILGAHIIGDQATELIAEMTLARRLEATTEELICTMHAHPTMHEAVHEAALAAEGRVIHA